MASAAPLMKGFTALPNDKESRFRYEGTKYNDKLWAVLFVVQLVVMGFFGAMYGKAVMNASEIEPSGGNWGRDMKYFVLLLFLAGVIGTIMGGVWLQVMKTCKIRTLLWMYVAVQLIITLGLLYLNVMAGIFSGLMLAVMVIWLFCCAERNIPFAEAVMKPSARSLQDHSGSICVAYVLAAVQIVWVAAWAFIFVSIFYHINPNGDQRGLKQDLVYVACLLSLYWTAEVVKNVGHVTTAGTVATWWFLPAAHNPTGAAFKRAITTSFGSICLGSLFVAILKTIRAILRNAENNARRSDNFMAVVLIACARCFLGCIESLVEWFNVYVYTHVAVYGEDYMSAARSTVGLLKSSLFTIIINENIIGMVLSLGVIVGGIATAAVTAIFALVLSMGSTWVMISAIVGGVVGIIMVSLVTNVMSSAIATTFVCWAEDPLAMQAGRPSEFKRMTDAAAQRYQDWRPHN